MVETEFFRFLGAGGILRQLAATYPTPRQKHEVPLWMYLASNLSMRLHGVHSFHAYPYVVRCGGLLNVFGPTVGHKVAHPDTGDITLHCAGFNRKNAYDRQTPCDQDYLRKLAKDTDAAALVRWFNTDVVRVLRAHRAFDAEGIFLGDASYLFVPDNPRYANAVRLLFDEHNHPVESARLTPAQRARCQWRRCYKLVSLLHTNRAGTCFLYAGLAVLPGNANECPVLYGLVDEFVRTVGRGVLRRLILDRGFLDGAALGRCKTEWGIDVLIPLRKNMDLYADALGLLRLPGVRFQPAAAPAPRPAPAPARRPAAIRRREAARQRTLQERRDAGPPPDPAATLLRAEVAALPACRSWGSCPVPLTVVVNRETYADGHEELWMLADTRAGGAPADRRAEYALRTAIEERHRQLKCFWDLTGFRARAFALIVNQVVFVALAYTLLQLHLLRTHRAELNAKTRPRVREQLLPAMHLIILYYQQRFAYLSLLEYQELLLTLTPAARRKILAKTRRLRRDLPGELANPRAP